MKIISHRVTAYLQHFLCLLLLWTLLRLGFYFINRSQFEIADQGLFYFLFHGFRFDIAALCMLNALWTFLYLLPIKWNVVYTKILVAIFTIINGIAILFEIADWGYFPYNHKRSTFEIFQIVGNSADFLSIFTSFLAGYWHLFLLAAGLIWILFKISKSINKRLLEKERNGNMALTWVIKQSVALILVAGLFVIGFRGGLQLKPISLKDAIRITNNENVPLVLNTSFSIISSSKDAKMERIEWMKEDVARHLHPTIFVPSPQSSFIQKNVIFIVLESFTKGFTSLSNMQSCTPFLDSIIRRSLTFNNAYANALHSNQGLPAIVSGLPGMMDQAFVNSIYANNKLTTIASLLKTKGYATGFYHGATNGSMSLDVFAKNAGYDRYFGRTEYNNEKDYDGNWGIWDEPFLQRTAQEINKLPEPFHALVFNINSHPPYTLPADKKSLFAHIKGQAINRSIAYADYSYSRFFETISKEPWYENTLFVFVADHASPVFDNDYFAHGLGKFEIPILIYDPMGSTIKPAMNPQLISQIDIVPTLMQLMQYDQSFYTLGRNVLTQPASVLTKLNNAHIFIMDGYRCVFEQQTMKALYRHPADSLGYYNLISLPEKKALIDKLDMEYKAMMQVYNNDLIDNKMWIP